MNDAGEERGEVKVRGGAKMKNPKWYTAGRTGKGRCFNSFSGRRCKGGATRADHYHTLPRCDSQNCNTPEDNFHSLFLLESREIVARYLETLKKEKNRFSHCAHDPRSSESIDLSWIFLPYVREKIYFVWRKYNRIFYSNRNFWKGKRRGFLPCIEIFFSIRAQI